MDLVHGERTIWIEAIPPSTKAVRVAAKAILRRLTLRRPLMLSFTRATAVNTHHGCFLELSVITRHAKLRGVHMARSCGPQISPWHLKILLHLLGPSDLYRSACRLGDPALSKTMWNVSLWLRHSGPKRAADNYHRPRPTTYTKFHVWVHCHCDCTMITYI